MSPDFLRRRRRRIERLEDLIEYLSGRGREWWRDIILGEVLGEQLAERVAEKILERLPQVQAPAPITPQLFMREPHTVFVYARTILIRSTRRGYIEEFGFKTASNQFKLFVKKDGEYLVPGLDYASLDAWSEQIGWLLADVDANGLYTVGIGGIEWDREFEIAIEPLQRPTTLTLYNVYWRYYEF